MDKKLNRREKIKFAIRMMKEIALCIKHQKTGWSIQDSNIVLKIVSDEIEMYRQKMKKILWIRELSCGHDRETNIAFMCKEYRKPEIGKECYCRECCKSVKIVAVRTSEKERSEVKNE